MPWKALSSLRLISQAKRYLLPQRLMDWRTALILHAKIALSLLTHSAHFCCQLILSIWVNAILALCCLLLLPLVELLTQLSIYLLRSRIQFVQLSSLCFHHWLPLHFWLLLFQIPLLIFLSPLLLKRRSLHTVARLLALLPLFQQILKVCMYLSIFDLWIWILALLILL